MKGFIIYKENMMHMMNFVQLRDHDDMNFSSGIVKHILTMIPNIICLSL